VANYTCEGDAIEGRKIICTFEERPSMGTEKGTRRPQSTIKGNPASATLSKVWKYVP